MDVQSSDPSDLDLLTQREIEVLLLLPEAQTNRGLSRRLGIAERTVRAHIGNVKEKLGLRSRMEAALLADRRRAALLLRVASPEE